MGVLLLDIVTTAAILFTVASGLMIILGVMKLINFAHGAFLTIGGYAAFVTTQLGWNPWLAIPFAAVVGFLLGLIVGSYVSAILGDLTIVVLAAVILRIRPQGLFSG